MEKNIFEKNPKKTIWAVILIFAATMDFFAALFFLNNNNKKYFYEKHRIPHHIYHHGLKKNAKATASWGGSIYNVTTNSLGFKDIRARVVSKNKEQKRILFIGDSFTEGIGVEHKNTFVGLLDEGYSHLEILNAGVVSYSPKLYFLKIQHLINTKKIEMDELFVFIDISDIQDELVYEDFQPGEANKFFLAITHKLKRYFEENSIIGNWIYSTTKKEFPEFDMTKKELQKKFNLESRKEFYHQRPMWTYKNAIYNNWGKKGLTLAQENMQKIVEICRENNINLHIVIYPWPAQIKQRNLNDRQVQAWQEFALEHQTSFINLYPLFINETPAKEVVSRYYIKGDVHWNEKGHKLVADKLKELKIFH